MTVPITAATVIAATVATYSELHDHHANMPAHECRCELIDTVPGWEMFDQEIDATAYVDRWPRARRPQTVIPYTAASGHQALLINHAVVAGPGAGPRRAGLARAARRPHPVPRRRGR